MILTNDTILGCESFNKSQAHELSISDIINIANMIVIFPRRNHVYIEVEVLENISGQLFSVV